MAIQRISARGARGLGGALALACALGLTLAPGAAAAQEDDLFAEPSAGGGNAAPAAPRKEPHKGVSRILELLDWRAPSATVLAHVKGQVEARYDKRLDGVRDALTIDRILREKKAELAAVDKALVSFRGQRTGFEASIIAEEFVPSQGESVLRIDDDKAQRYYFFADDSLYKIVVAYNTSVSRQVPFVEFVKQVSAKYGRPVDQTWTTPAGGSRTLKSALWNDEITRLTVEDRSSFFGTFVMKFVAKGDGEAKEARHAEVQKNKPSVAASGFADSMMGDIMVEGGGADENVVDQVTGTQHDIDLQTGRPNDERLNYQSADEGDGASASAKGGKKGKKGGKGGKAAKRDAQRADPVADSPPANNIDDIIY